MSTLTAAAGTAEATSLKLPEAAGRPVDEVLDLLVTAKAGLTESEARSRLHKFGPNVLPTRPVTAFGILRVQLRNPLLALLLGAAVVSAFTGGLTDSAIIAAIMVLSVGLGFVNEYRAARAVAALHGDIRYEALVWCDGRQRELDVSLLVPGDVVALRVGGVVPADLRILEAEQLECDEAVLTGESMAAAKTADPVNGTEPAVDRPSLRSSEPSSTRGPTRRRGRHRIGHGLRRDCNRPRGAPG